MAEGDRKPTTYDALHALCAQALLDEQAFTNAASFTPESLAERAAEIVLRELEESCALFVADRWNDDCHSCEIRIGDHTVDGKCPSIPTWGSWTEPPAADVEELARWGVHAADRVALDLANRDLTGHQMGRKMVHESIRLLLANGLARATLPATGEEVSVWMDPPPPELQGQ